MAKIRLVKPKPTVGDIGDILDVSDDRAVRWIRDGFAVDAVAPDEPQIKPDEKEIDEVVSQEEPSSEKTETKKRSTKKKKSD